MNHMDQTEHSEKILATYNFASTFINFVGVIISGGASKLGYIGEKIHQMIWHINGPWLSKKKFHEQKNCVTDHKTILYA